jgi:hypothetical protein
MQRAQHRVHSQSTGLLSLEQTYIGSGVFRRQPVTAGQTDNRRFTGTLFDAPIDAAAEKVWYQESTENSLTPRRTTQNRHLGRIAELFDIGADGEARQREEDRVFLPQRGWVRFINSREIEATPGNVTVSRRGDHWPVSIQTEREAEHFKRRDMFRPASATSEAPGKKVRARSRWNSSLLSDRGWRLAHLRGAAEYQQDVSGLWTHCKRKPQETNTAQVVGMRFRRTRRAGWRHAEQKGRTCPVRRCSAWCRPGASSRNPPRQPLRSVCPCVGTDGILGLPAGENVNCTAYFAKPVAISTSNASPYGC